MGMPQELIYKAYYDQNNTSSLITKNIYYGQLTILANNHNMNLNEITKQIEHLEYKEDDLIKIISQINGNNKNHIAEINNRYKNRFFIGVGLNTSTLKYEGDSPFPNATGSTSSFPKLTFGFDAFANPNIGHLILRIELGLTMCNFSFTSISHYGATSQDITTQKVKQLTASVTPQFIYNFYNANLFKAFLGAGLSMNFSSYPTNKYTRDNTIYSYYSTTKSNFPEMQNLWVSFPVKTGIVLNKKLEIVCNICSHFFSFNK